MKIAKKAAVVLCAGLMLISPGVVSQPAYGEFPTTLTVKAAATTHDISQGNVTINDSGEHIITGTTITNKITIEGGTPTVTVRYVNITLSDGCPLTVHSGNFTLIIEGENTFKSGNCAGIDVAVGNKITIKESQSTKGALNAIGGGQSSGIGGGSWGSAGTIIIESGTVNATAGDTGGAGIGGGYAGDGGTVTINGGTVTASGGNGGAGIGGGTNRSGGKVTINGGTVNAYGSGGGAGIGGGMGAGGGDFTINAGNVTAYGGDAGIGSGSWGGPPGTATYNGGTVNGVTYPRYTVEIPATVNLSQEKDTTSKISVRDVFIGQGKSVNVKLTGASPSPNNTTFHVKSNNNVVVDYTIKKNNQPVKINENLLSVTGNSSGTAELTFSAPKITFAGTYTGTLTFTISVS